MPVGVLAREEERLAATVDEVTERGGRATSVSVDVADVDAMEAAAAVGESTVFAILGNRLAGGLMDRLVGAFDYQVVSWSPQVWVATHRRAASVLAAAAGAALAGLAVGRRRAG